MQHKLTLLILALALLALTLAGCDQLGGQRGEVVPTATSAPRPEMAALNAAQQALEAALGRALPEVEVAFGPAEWLDTGLGCPLENQTVEATPVSGFQIEITVDGVTYELHSNADGSQVHLCPLPPAEVDALAAARAWLAGQLGIDPTLLPAPALVEPAEWPTAALGCPQEGQAYAEMLVSGFRLDFEVDSVRYELHASQDGSQLALCASETLVELVPTVAPVTADFPAEMQRPVDQALALLGGQLGLAPETIVPDALSWQETVFPSTALGCPEPDTVYAQVETSGYSLLLTYAGSVYELHVDRNGNKAVLCAVTRAPSAQPTPAPTPTSTIVVTGPLDIPPGRVFTSFSDERFGFGVSYPLGWQVSPGPAENQVLFELPGQPLAGMLVTRFGPETAGSDVWAWLEDYQSSLYSAEPAAVAVSEVLDVGNGAIAIRFSRVLGGVPIIEQLALYPQGYQVRQWIPADFWTDWQDPFAQMLASLVWLGQ